MVTVFMLQIKLELAAFLYAGSGTELYLLQAVLRY